MAVDDSYTVALLHMDGSDASTTFTDESGKTWTAAGNAQIDTAQSKFSGASGLFDGTGDYLTSPDHADFNLSGDFTIDCWARFNSIAAQGTIFSLYTDDNNRLLWFWNQPGPTMKLVIISGGSYVLTVDSASWTPTTATWYHLAISRSGNEYRQFIDGVQSGSTTTDADGPGNYTDVAAIGARKLAGAYGLGFNGWIDEIRLSKGIARWTVSFTPPTAPYEQFIPGVFVI